MCDGQKLLIPTQVDALWSLFSYSFALCSKSFKFLGLEYAKITCLIPRPPSLVSFSSNSVVSFHISLIFLHWMLYLLYYECTIVISLLEIDSTRSCFFFLGGGIVSCDQTNICSSVFLSQPRLFRRLYNSIAISQKSSK